MEQLTLFEIAKQLEQQQQKKQVKKYVTIDDIKEIELTELSQNDIDKVNSIPYQCIKIGWYVIHKDKVIIAKYWTGKQYLYLYKIGKEYLLTNATTQLPN